MKLSIYAEGPGFRDNSEIEAVIDLLKGYEVGLHYCLKRSANTHDVHVSIHYPKLKLNYAGSGSIDISLVTDVAAAIAPLAPQIFGYGWQLYKAAFDIVSIATQYFKKTGKPIMIHIENSPGTEVNIVNGDQVKTHRDVFDSALNIHKMLGKIASLIKGHKAEKIIMEADLPDPQNRIQFDQSNHDDFFLPSTDTLDETPVEFECNIYHFNKRTLNGWLEYYDEEELQRRQFTASEDTLEACLDCFRASKVKATAHREMEVNALGETKIKKFHLIAVSLTPDS